MNQPGYEHLREKLHVHITAEGPDMADCQRRLERAVSIVNSLLTPTYDEYKKTQLLQLAIINGTYRANNKKQNTVIKATPKLKKRHQKVECGVIIRFNCISIRCFIRVI